MTTERIFALLVVCTLLVGGCATSPTARQTGSPLTAEINTAPQLIDATAALSEVGLTRLHPFYIRGTLLDREQDPAIDAAFHEAMAQGTFESRLELMRALELKFIHDPETSALDILGPELSDHFRNFDWEYGDFPGGPEGSNEQFADVMVDVLDIVCPERRANQSRVGVVLRAEATGPVWTYVTNQWVVVPGQTNRKLNRHACESFVRMREHASAEGVDLVILSGHRHPKTAQRNAARAGNSNAVASFSSHSLGLAIDLEMSHREDIEFKELSTRPMAELVRMRQSPVHKWLVLRGDDFGWYPYQNEPWHWEYNPPGFHASFWADYPGGAPDRPVLNDRGDGGG
jgi:hypothetical protein